MRAAVWIATLQVPKKIVAKKEEKLAVWIATLQVTKKKLLQKKIVAKKKKKISSLTGHVASRIKMRQMLEKFLM